MKSSGAAVAPNATCCSRGLTSGDKGGSGSGVIAASDLLDIERRGSCGLTMGDSDSGDTAASDRLCDRSDILDRERSSSSEMDRCDLCDALDIDRSTSGLCDLLDIGRSVSTSVGLCDILDTERSSSCDLLEWCDVERLGSVGTPHGDVLLAGTKGEEEPPSGIENSGGGVSDMTERWRSCSSSSLLALCPLSLLPSEGTMVVDPEGWVGFSIEADNLASFSDASSRPRRSQVVRPLGGGSGFDGRRICSAASD